VKSGTFVQKLHCDAREKFTGNNELIKTRSTRTSPFTIAGWRNFARQCFSNDLVHNKIDVDNHACLHILFLLFLFI
jgi:hypothetical protein